MFCGKCGAQLPDGAVFCGSCGSPVAARSGQQMQPEGQVRQNQEQSYRQGQYQQNQSQQGQYRQNQAQQGQYAQNPYQQQGQYQQNQHRQNQAQQGQYQQGSPYQANQYRQYNQARQTASGKESDFAAPSPANNKKKIILIAAIAAAAVVIILLVVFLGGGGGSTATPEGTIKKLEKAMNDMDMKKMMECFDSESQSLFGDQDIDLKAYIDAFGIEYTISLKPTHTEYFQSGGQEYATVTVDMSFSASAFGQSTNSSQTEDLTLVKENGEWKISSEYYDEVVGSLYG